MNVALRPLREDEYSGFLERAIERYTEDMVENGGFTPETARAKSTSDHARLFARGLETEGVDVFAVEADGGVAGSAVLGRRERDGRTIAFVYDVWIDPTHRGQGLGRRTMELLADRARASGLERVELNVFGGNSVARSLYRSLGYQETAVTMAKDLV